MTTNTNRLTIETCATAAKAIAADLRTYSGDVRDARLIDRARAKALKVAEALDALGAAMDKAAEPYIETHTHCTKCGIWLCLDAMCGADGPGRGHETAAFHTGRPDLFGPGHRRTFPDCTGGPSCPQPDPRWRPARPKPEPTRIDWDRVVRYAIRYTEALTPEEREIDPLARATMAAARALKIATDTKSD